MSTIETTPTAPTAALRTVLNIGCGPTSVLNRHEHFAPGEWREIRLDINPDVNPDIVATVTDMAPVPEASVDVVWSSHNLEHLYNHDVPVALRECLRVLKPGGHLLLMVPDLQAVAAVIAEDKLHEVLYVSPAGPITPMDVVYGFSQAIASGQTYMAHLTGFTPTVLGSRLVEAGFDPITLKRTSNYELIAMAYRPAAAA